MYRNTQKFNFHKDISIAGFQTFDIDQRYIDAMYTLNPSRGPLTNPYFGSNFNFLNATFSGEQKSIELY
ncbi:MAG: hypothetical protein CM15mP100_5780 [Alphaproteobacteria bacterium]|nr:MAG: hypothetical protein CM15mP100_5780 [Alphaproteobacteria bacterium]